MARKILTVALAMVLVLGAGCSMFGGKKKGGTTPKAAAPKPVYYDFNDVLIPAELKVDREASFVYSASGLTAGVLVFNGRVDLNSLIRFFEHNMAKDNWSAVSSFKSARTILLFKKAGRWCVININEGKWAAEVEVWVAPTNTGGQQSDYSMRSAPADRPEKGGGKDEVFFNERVDPGMDESGLVK
jgi:hypothetical protein